MRDAATPEQLIQAVSELLRERVLPKLEPALAYELRVAINALGLTQRAMQREALAQARERAGLRALLGDAQGDLDTLNAQLCDAIAHGAIALDSRQLIEHLWTRSLDRLGIDQPGYSAYRAHRPRDD